MRIFILAAICLIHTLCSEEKIISETHIPAINLTEFILKNGMKVAIKPNDKESGEIYIELLAEGGFASLPLELQPSARALGLLVEESGLDGLSADQLSALLYTKDVDFTLDIQPFSRIIVCQTSQEGLVTALRLIQLAFTEPKIDPTKIPQVISHKRSQLQKKPLDADANLESAFLALNTQNYKPLESMTMEDLNLINAKAAKDVFTKAFSDPAQFSCIIVGDVDAAQVKPIIVSSLAMISKGETFSFKKPQFTSFPAGVKNKIFPISNRTDSMTRLSFPLQVEITEKNIYLLELATQAIGNALNENGGFPVDVSYEFPFYPYRDGGWVVLQYHSDYYENEKTAHRILKELRELQQKEISKETLKKIMDIHATGDEYWLKENSFWIGILTNNLVWKWDPKSLVDHYDFVEMTPAKIKTILQTYIDTSHYSRITTKPL